MKRLLLALIALTIATAFTASQELGDARGFNKRVCRSSQGGRGCGYNA
jgi:hypothetical protein